MMRTAKPYQIVPLTHTRNLGDLDSNILHATSYNKSRTYPISDQWEVVGTALGIWHLVRAAQRSLAKSDIGETALMGKSHYIIMAKGCAEWKGSSSRPNFLEWRAL